MKASRTPAEAAAQRAFVERAVARIREVLYAEATDAVIAREWPDLVLAVTEPAAYLRERGKKLPGSRYMAILDEVLRGIKAHGNFAASRYKPAYLRHCIQQHMRLRGEVYLDEAKAADARSAGALAKAVAGKMRPVPGDPDADRLTEALAAAREMLIAPKIRRRNA